MLEHHVKVGDRVAMSVQWLQSTGQQAGEVGHLRGTVQLLEQFTSFAIATVQWDQGFNARINVKNLAKVGLNGKFSAC